MLHNFWMDLPHRCLSHGWLCLACPQLRRELQAFTCLVNFSDTSLGMSGAGPSEVTVSFHLCWVPSQLLFRKVFNSVFTATRTDRYCCLALEVRERRLGSDANCSESGTAECQGSNVGLMLHPLRCGGPFPSLRWHPVWRLMREQGPDGKAALGMVVPAELGLGFSALLNCGEIRLEMSLGYIRF